jgi:hypothetical protein
MGAMASEGLHTSSMLPAAWHLSLVCYNFRMESAKHLAVLDRLLGPLCECLTPESARRLLILRADPALQARVQVLAERHSKGLLTPQEQAEYGKYVAFSTFVAILKSKARQLLAADSGE